MVAPRPPDPVSPPAPCGPRLGIYIHCLFCRRRCPYCDFNVAIYRPDRLRVFLEALHAECDLYARQGWARTVSVPSIFLGGGTPSLLEPADVARLLHAMRERFHVLPSAEVTLEANPEGLTEERLRGFRSAGVTRLSLGVQSLDDELLRVIGREHPADQARRVYRWARLAGFDNVSVDLLYALPGQDLFRWEVTLDEVLDWRPEHLSAYALTIEAGTPFAHRPPMNLPDEEAEVAQYHSLLMRAEAAGYEPYEISNFARPGFRSIHNQLYWHGEEYVGLGPGAHSHLGGVRFANFRSQVTYRKEVLGGHFPIEWQECLSAEERLGERIVFGLRLQEGVPRGWLETRFAAQPDRLNTLLEHYQTLGLLVEEGDRVYLTEQGRLLSNTVFAELV